ncbi:MAG: protein BatD [Candidatus Hydrogenedentes bacterium]|nr:protein BatD [Candidatus Hydrogenedentota bacterium]
MRGALPILLILLAVVLPASAQVVTATVAKKQVEAGSLFRITLEASGGAIEDPVLPELEGIEINPAPISNISSMQYQFSNGKQSTVSRRTWVYEASASREGAITLPAIGVTIDGKPYTTQPIALTVEKAGPAGTIRPGNRSRLQQRPPAPAPQTRNVPAEAPPAGQKPLTFDDLIFIKSAVGKTTVYQGEQVMLRLSLYQLDSMAIIEYRGGRTYPLPEIEGFYQGKAIDDERTENVNGYEYTLHEWTIPLYPTGVGDYYIGPWEWKGYVSASTDRGPTTVQRELKTDPIEITVKSLPERPAGFSGAVGKFEIKSRLLDSDVIQGVPAKLLIEVTGEGNPDAIGAPVLPAIPWAHVSDPAIEIKPPDRQAALQVRKTFTYSITPQEVGDRNLPEVSYIYFSPEKEAYVTETDPPFTIHVKPSGESGEMVVVGGSQEQRAGLKELADDLHPIMTSAQPLRPRGSGVALGVLGALAPPLAFGFFWARTLRTRRLQEDSAYARDYYALANFNKRLEQVSNARDPLEELYAAGAGYIADKFNVSASGMTSEDARAVLSRHLPQPEMVEGLLKILRRCERYRYAGSALQANELQALIEGAQTVVEQVEQALKERAR